MSEQDSASEKLQKKIFKLTQEKSLLRSRLNSLNKENNPSSKSREQARRTEQIEQINKRIILIDEELKKEKYFLARAEDRPIKELKKLLKNPAVETAKGENKLNKLEEFINLTAKSDMVFHSPTKSNETKSLETVTNTEAKNNNLDDKAPPVTSEPLVTISNVDKQKVSFANIDEKGAHNSNIDTEGAKSLAFTSTPKQTTSKADVMPTSIYGSKVTPNAFEFPPTYENPELRAARLERERFLRNEFDKRMELESNMNREFKNTGAIPRVQFKPTVKPQTYLDLDLELLQSEQKMIEDSIRMSQRLEAQGSGHNQIENLYPPQSNVSKNENNLSRIGRTEAHNFEQDEVTWNENPRKFINYKPTPQRMNLGREHKIMNLVENSYSNQEVNQNSPYDQGFLGQQRPRMSTRNENLNYSYPSGEMNQNSFDNLNQFGPRPQMVVQNENFIDSYPNRDTNQNFSAQQYTHTAPRNENFNRLNYSYQNTPTGGNFPIRANTQVASRNTNYNALMNDGQNNNTVRNSFLRRLRIIPKFGGDSFKDLKDFIDTSETLYYSCLNGAEEQEFYEQMALQLRGEPKLIISRLENFDWINIRDTLLKKFAYLSNKDVLTSQIENLHQEQGESLTEYTERARNLLKEKNLIYSHLTEEQRTEHNRMARRAFSKGILNNKLREKIMIRGAGSLEDAIAFAIEAENDALTEVPRNELYCRFCHINGHREKQCRRKESDNSDIGRLASAIRSLGFNNRFNQNNFRNNQRNFGNMNRNFAPNFNRNSFNPNWNQNRNNDTNFWNGNRNNNPFNRGQNGNQSQNQANQNQNNNFAQNRGNFQSNSRQQQRTNNVVRNARINTVQTNPHMEIRNDDFLMEQTEN